MNRIVYVLKAFFDYELYLLPGELKPEKSHYFVFSNVREADKFFNRYCGGCGITEKVRCINDIKFYEGVEVDENDLFSDWWNKRKETNDLWLR